MEPYDLNDAINQLMNISFSQKSSRELYFLIKHKWKLNRKSILVKWFYSINIYNMSDIYDIIINSYKRYKDNLPIALDDQIETYHNYYKNIYGSNYLNIMKSKVTPYLRDEVIDNILK